MLIVNQEVKEKEKECDVRGIGNVILHEGHKSESGYPN